MIPTPASITKTATHLPSVVTGYVSPYPTVVIVTSAHHSASPPSVIVASGAPLSSWMTSSVATEMTRKAESTVMNPAYWPRFSSTSRMSRRRLLPLSMRLIRISRLRRARRSSAVAGNPTRAGNEPRRSSQPRWVMKYSRFGWDLARLIPKSARKMTQMKLSNAVRAEIVGSVERKQQQRHDEEREHREHQHEDGVRVALGPRLDLARPPVVALIAACLLVPPHGSRSIGKPRR